ncbi:MAG TPA: flagellar biosynthetic protein FliO [Tepidisphaeraceae bacterium]|nr:flagellar biosynthetic protein FliO [Tepidisphaeraceae bacterium]
MNAGLYWRLAGEPARRSFFLSPNNTRRAGSPAKRSKVAFLAALALCFALVAGRAFADTATTPGASAGLSIASASDGSTIENQPIRGGLQGKPGDAEGNTGSAPSGFDTVHVAGALALVVVLIFGLRFLARKMFALPTVRTTPMVKVLARSAVSPKQHVLLLHVGRRILVVADSGAAMQPLAQITDADEIASLLGQLSNNNAGLARSQFGSLFNRLRRDFETDDLPAGAEAADEVADLPEDADPATAQPAGVAQTTEELHGLMEKVRLVSRRLGQT